MARRSATRKRQPQKSPWQAFADVAMRPGTIGAVLVIVAIFTLLSLLAGSRGSVTGAWVSGLQYAFGEAAWLVPAVTGIVGLWLVLSSMDPNASYAWRRPAGIIVLFSAFLIGAGLYAPIDQRAQLAADGAAGGKVGSELATLLQTTITPLGSWAFVAFLAFSGIIFLTDRLLIDGTAGLYYRARELAERRSHSNSQYGRIQPQFPLPVGEVSLWTKWRERLMGSPSTSPLTDTLSTPIPPGQTLVRPEPSSPSATLRAAAAPPTVTSTAVAPARTASALDPDLLQPHIIGGMQEWRLPRLQDMLSDWERRTDSDDLIRQQGRMIQETLALFGVPADFEGAYKGPSVTQYLIKPGYVERNIKGEQQRIKVKVAKIAALANDLALALAAPSVRIEAPIPGTNYVGIEVPNRESNVVGLKELMESETYTGMKGRLRIALGEDVKGQAVVADLARMPHLLIAGATGSGKSVCINSIITCLLLTHTPESLRMLMVDPKMVELSIYNGAPHLLSPVVTDVDKAASVLYWAVKEMERRYALFNKAGARDLTRYNEYLAKRGEKALPYIVVIVDEMADLMMAAPEEVEKHICRLAQMARATGMHLIIATQRPSVDVITGLIKANFPARIAFAVTSQVDSRVILDIPGAERLLGRGDMLFMAPDASKLERLQGTFLSDEEINKVVRYWKGIRVLEPGQQPLWESVQGQEKGVEGSTGVEPVKGAPASLNPGLGLGGASSASSSAFRTPVDQPPLFEQIDAMRAVDGRDVLFDDAARAVREAGKGSVSLLQKKLRIGYGRAARLVEQLEEAGILGPDQGGASGRPLAGTAPAPPMPPSKLTPRIIGGEDDSNPPSAPNVWM